MVCQLYLNGVEKKSIVYWDFLRSSLVSFLCSTTPLRTPTTSPYVPHAATVSQIFLVFDDHGILRCTGQHFVECFLIGVCLMFLSWLDWGDGFGAKRTHRDKSPFSSRYTLVRTRSVTEAGKQCDRQLLGATLRESCPGLPVLEVSTGARNLNVYVKYPTFKYWQRHHICKAVGAHLCGPHAPCRRANVSSRSPVCKPSCKYMGIVEVFKAIEKHCQIWLAFCFRADSFRLLPFCPSPSLLERSISIKGNDSVLPLTKTPWSVELIF